MEHDVHQQQLEEPMELPPGFRFHPTDEELVTHYLARKTADPTGFAARAVGEADLNKCEPWDLPSRATMGEKEWYFFVVKDRKYPTGTRTNRATESGYWKATGKDREILRGKALVGMKKTLVFYTGRAPKGGKTGWVMHEYRLEGKHAPAPYSLPRAATSKDEWVLCRVFKKSLEPSAAGSNNGARKGACTGMAADAVGSSMSLADAGLAALPPLIDVAASGSFAPPPAAHVTCFSNALEGQFLNPPFLLPATTAAAAHSAGENIHIAMESAASPFFASMYTQDVSGGMAHEFLLDGGGGGWYSKGERERLSGASQDTGLTSEVNPTEISSSRQHMDHEPTFWGY
ncbi:NAC domain-containing protein 92 isoform X2 [Brachypodium distachyon]|uniref:NAC domain-containing protein n=1 Tax=Brachypodium distachyon TaxID=15368 RepID=I1IAW8_BRADI|nr:NAC domain-containing protein 92 isoform X2 [Brachypodium distachyon]KQK00031.1 hypothetical protein BRADI_3g46900v3 [Brachypodium distachyon]KQK00032.1 hypothetical protein BRADI_3g46900v3 [Brachypodium distachyon]KQK00033.1 hypothetical protein BRADI_3g46900v3 [Brachypodium distachyon]|eukprot:XP_010235594.1 NAC domain-containing protein 92 isoform X2 [Brachypodium distachyon]